MAMPRKPTALKVLHGAEIRNKAEPKPEAELLRAPAWLKGEARAEWKRIAPKLYRLGLLSELDSSALAAYCQARGRFREAVEQLEAEGYIVTAPSGYPIPSPWVAIQNSAHKAMLEGAREFGLSPASRTKVSAAGTPKKQDPFAIFDGGKKS